MLFFSRWPRTAIAHTSKFVGVQHKNNIWETSMYPKQSSEKMLILARIGLFGVYEGPRFQDMPSISSTTWCEIQTFGFVNANILLIKIGDVWEREVNPKMAEEIKDGGESSWWQGGCKPNRTHTLTAILAESAMNKEKGREERLSERQFSLLVICDCHELYIIWLLGIRMCCRGSHINRGGRSSLWLWNCDKFIAQTNWHSLEHLRVSLGSSH